MNIVVDTNIVFSALLSPNGTINDLLLNSTDQFSFLAPTFLIEELDKHHSKLKSISGFNDQEINFLKRTIFRHIEFIDLEIIKNESWLKGYDLAKGIDEKDTPFIALTIDLNAKLWTGDKKLIKGLSKKEFTSFLSTENIQEIRK